jgi:hypothetical protein
MDHGEEATESGLDGETMGGAVEAIIEGLSRSDGADVRVQAAQVLAALHRHQLVIVREEEQLPHLSPPTSDLIDAVTDGDDDPDAGATDELTPALA